MEQKNSIYIKKKKKPSTLGVVSILEAVTQSGRILNLEIIIINITLMEKQFDTYLFSNFWTDFCLAIIVYYSFSCMFIWLSGSLSDFESEKSCLHNLISWMHKLNEISDQ